MSNKMAAEYPVLQCRPWLQSVITWVDSFLWASTSPFWPLTTDINKKKLILILVFAAQHISSWNEMAPTTLPRSKSLKSYFFPALMLALNFGKSSYLHGKMLWCCPVVTSTWSAQDEVAREHYMPHTWMHHVTYSSWKDAHTERCSSGQPAHDWI